ncbi:hypothetical protein LIER_27191 [Lithospermum erythrorhizon]|uniref:Uncharacterized protein n=1 Tax=Lithospermum erythrorhizon TaxID=34254 RepID=A0AAV3RF37_LITER
MIEYRTKKEIAIIKYKHKISQEDDRSRFRPGEVAGAVSSTLEVAGAKEGRQKLLVKTSRSARRSCCWSRRSSPVEFEVRRSSLVKGGQRRCSNCE